jgi:hypothetical protein
VLKKSCAIATVVMLALFAGYWRLLHGRVEFPIDLILAAFGAIGLAMLASQLKQVILGSPDTPVLKRALANVPFEDGRREAAWGPILPLGDLLTAPFSGRACVAYEYDAKKPDTWNRRGERQPQGSVMSGFALAPCRIASQRGEVRLLGFGMLDAFPDRDYASLGDARIRARDYLAGTSFTDTGVTKLGSMLSQMDAALADDDGAVRQDWRIGSSGPDDLERCALIEKVVLAGDLVTAIGVWDMPQGGLVPHREGKSAIVSLAPGDGATALARARQRPWGLLAFALVWSGFIHVFIYLILTRAPK